MRQEKRRHSEEHREIIGEEERTRRGKGGAKARLDNARGKGKRNLTRAHQLDQEESQKKGL